MANKKTISIDEQELKLKDKNNSSKEYTVKIQKEDKVDVADYEEGKDVKIKVTVKDGDTELAKDIEVTGKLKKGFMRDSVELPDSFATTGSTPVTVESKGKDINIKGFTWKFHAAWGSAVGLIVVGLGIWFFMSRKKDSEEEEL